MAQGIDLKGVQALQSKIVAAAAGYDITDLQVQVNATEFYISVKGVKSNTQQPLASVK